MKTAKQIAQKWVASLFHGDKKQEKILVADLAKDIEAYADHKKENSNEVIALSGSIMWESPEGRQLDKLDGSDN